jgi:hypothetical protein
MSSNVSSVSIDFTTLDLNDLATVSGGDGQPESADTRWGRRIGGVVGAGGGAAAGFLGASAVTANPVVGVIGAGAGGAAGQYAGESYGAHRGASGLAFDALMATNPVTSTANSLYQGYRWLRGK